MRGNSNAAIGTEDAQLSIIRHSTFGFLVFLRVLCALCASALGGKVEQRLPLGQAFAFADREFAAYARPAFVDPAQHRDSVHGGAPAVIEAPHDLPAPLVRRDEFSRRIIVAHQDDFQLAATRFA